MSNGTTRTYFDIHRDMRAEMSTLADDLSYDQEINHITQLVRNGQPAAATYELDKLKQLIRVDLRSIAALLCEWAEKKYENNVEMVMLRRELAEGAQMFAVVTDDNESASLFDGYVQKYDRFFAEGISDLDPDR